MEVDYLIIGAGAIGLTFADILIAESDATVAIVDRRPNPGGHWNDAYDFVRLHQPSAFYGVNSLELGSGRKDTVGLNAGFYELATGPEVLAYFEHVMSEVLLPSGRVSFLAEHDYHGDGRVRCLNTGTDVSIKVRRKIVDATYYGTVLSLHHTPAFDINDRCTVVPPQHMFDRLGQDSWDKICILGGGKTGFDVAVELLNQGHDPDQICWVRPREAWYMNRQMIQPGSEFFHDTIGMQAHQLEIMAQARSPQDLFLQLEKHGQMLRIDERQTPGMFHCAIASKSEISLLQNVTDVVSGARVTAITPGGLHLSSERKVLPERTLHIDCTAPSVTRRAPKPVFENQLVTPQIVRTCQPIFSAAILAHIELREDTDEAKNDLARVVPLPDVPEDYLAATTVNMMNQYQWQRDRQIRRWLSQSRLDAFHTIMRDVAPDDTEKLAVLEKFRDGIAPAIGNLNAMIGMLPKAG